MSDETARARRPVCSWSAAIGWLAALCCWAAFLWAATCGWYEWASRQDAYWAFAAKFKVVLLCMGLLTAAAGAVVWRAGLSRVGAAVAFVIALVFSSMVPPVVARSRRTLREAIDADRYYEFHHATAIFVSFAVLLIGGLAFVWFSNCRAAKRAEAAPSDDVGS